jgi:ATP-binding cassette subfamily G (WHITE) protein 2 (SNQ2)
MRAPQQRLDQQTRSQYTNTIVDILTTIFGLRHARNTPVGDAAIRGVSGGEKKRVSIAEALASRMRLGSWDNSTRGLDSSTALEFGRALRIATEIDHLTTIVSIYQAGESLYQLFDKVCVIYEGKMAYFGPADQARQYFVDMGYDPVNSRQVTPDFLVAVTDPKGRVARPGFTSIPRTAAEFAEYFKKSPLGEQNRRDMEAYERDFVGKSERVTEYQKSARAEHAKSSRKSSSFTISIPMQVRAVMLRRVQIIRGNMLSFIIQLA